MKVYQKSFYDVSWRKLKEISCVLWLSKYLEQMIVMELMTVWCGILIQDEQISSMNAWIWWLSSVSFAWFFWLC